MGPPPFLSLPEKQICDFLCVGKAEMNPNITVSEPEYLKEFGDDYVQLFKGKPQADGTSRKHSTYFYLDAAARWQVWPGSGRSVRAGFVVVGILPATGSYLLLKWVCGPLSL